MTMERKIGDKFTDCCVDYVVEDAPQDNSPCFLCAFGICEQDGINMWITCCAPFITGECAAASRSDGKNVYFRRVEK